MELRTRLSANLRGSWSCALGGVLYCVKVVNTEDLEWLFDLVSLRPGRGGEGAGGLGRPGGQPEPELERGRLPLSLYDYESHTLCAYGQGLLLTVFLRRQASALFFRIDPAEYSMEQLPLTCLGGVDGIDRMGGGRRDRAAHLEASLSSPSPPHSPAAFNAAGVAGIGGAAGQAAPDVRNALVAELSGALLPRASGGESGACDGVSAGSGHSSPLSRSGHAGHCSPVLLVGGTGTQGIYCADFVTDTCMLVGELPMGIQNATMVSAPARGQPGRAKLYLIAGWSYTQLSTIFEIVVEMGCGCIGGRGSDPGSGQRSDPSPDSLSEYALDPLQEPEPAGWRFPGLRVRASRLADAPFCPRDSHSSALYLERFVLTFGGLSSGTHLGDLWVFDPWVPERGVWAWSWVDTPAPSPREDAVLFCPPGGDVYITGGTHAMFKFDVWRFRPFEILERIVESGLRLAAWAHYLRDPGNQAVYERHLLLCGSRAAQELFRHSRL